MDFQRLFYINHEFENRTFDWVRLIFFLFGEFDWVRLKFSSIGFDLLCREESMYGLSAGTKKVAVVERWRYWRFDGICMFVFFSVCRKWTKIWITSALVSKQGTVIKKGGRAIKVEWNTVKDWRIRKSNGHSFTVNMAHVGGVGKGCGMRREEAISENMDRSIQGRSIEVRPI